jgi:hypothetical protein
MKSSSAHLVEKANCLSLCFPKIAFYVLFLHRSTVIDLIDYIELMPHDMGDIAAAAPSPAPPPGTNNVRRPNASGGPSGAARNSPPAEPGLLFHTPPREVRVAPLLAPLLPPAAIAGAERW